MVAENGGSVTGEAWGRRRRILAWLAGLTAAALAIHVAPALAEANSVRIEPPRADVAANSRTRVALVAEPPAATLGAWVIEVRFDPDVVTTTSRDCDPIDSPPGAAAAVGCARASLRRVCCSLGVRTWKHSESNSNALKRSRPTRAPRPWCDACVS